MMKSYYNINKNFGDRVSFISLKKMADAIVKCGFKIPDDGLKLDRDYEISEVPLNYMIFSLKNFGAYCTYIRCTVDEYYYVSQITWSNHDFSLGDLENGEPYESGDCSPTLSEEEHETVLNELIEIVRNNRAKVLDLLNQ